MDSSRFLILGANGQLGRALQAQYPNAQVTDISELDITNKDSIEGYNWSNVTTILNAGAYTNVDGAESPEGRIAAWKVNATAVSNLSKVAIKKDLLLVHISTEYVFDGTRSPHKEDEPLNPLSSYGASKAAGDIAAGFAPKHYILRASWVIGEGKNIAQTMLDAGRKLSNMKVINDQIGRPTFATELARAIDHLLNSTPSYGIYNLSNGGTPVSLADLTRAIFNEAGLKTVVEETTDAEYFADKPQAAKRPLKRTFDLSKIEATGFTPRDWREDLRDYIKKELST